MWVGRGRMCEELNVYKRAKRVRLVGTACHYGFIY